MDKKPTKDDITVVVTYFEKPKKAMLRCIESIEKLGLKYIIVDDASADNGMKNVLDNVITLEDNVGAYRAFEIGMEQVTTDYVMRVDADDYIIGVPDICGEYDAYINNTHGKIHFDLPKFINHPWAGINGAVVKLDVMKKVWYSKVKRMGDLIIFVRLVNRFNCKLMDKDIYFYDRSLAQLSKGREGREAYQYVREIALREINGERDEDEKYTTDTTT